MLWIDMVLQNSGDTLSSADLTFKQVADCFLAGQPCILASTGDGITYHTLLTQVQQLEMGDGIYYSCNNGVFYGRADAVFGSYIG